MYCDSIVSDYGSVVSMQMYMYFDCVLMYLMMYVIVQSMVDVTLSLYESVDKRREASKFSLCMLQHYALMYMITLCDYVSMSVCVISMNE